MDYQHKVHPFLRKENDFYLRDRKSAVLDVKKMTFQYKKSHLHNLRQLTYYYLIVVNTKLKVKKNQRNTCHIGHEIIRIDLKIRFHTYL